MKKLSMVIVLGMLLAGFGGVAQAESWIGFQGAVNDYEEETLGLQLAHRQNNVTIVGTVAGNHMGSFTDRYSTQNRYKFQAKAEMLYSAKIKFVEVFAGLGLQHTDYIDKIDHHGIADWYVWWHNETLQVFGVALDTDTARLELKYTYSEYEENTYSVGFAVKF